VRADAAFSEAANRAAVAFEAAPSVPIARGFWLPTTIRCVPAPSKQGAQNRRRVGRSFGSGILPIWTNRRSPSGALSPLRCRRELIPIPLGQTLCQASAQSSGERQQQSVHHRLLPGCDFCAARTACASPKARLLIKRHGADAALPDVLLAPAPCERSADFFAPAARFTDLAASANRNLQEAVVAPLQGLWPFLMARKPSTQRVFGPQAFAFRLTRRLQPPYPWPPEQAPPGVSKPCRTTYASPKEGRYDSQAIRCPYGPR
jgi:hypothetical protein